MPHNSSEDPKSVGLEVFRLARKSAHLLGDVREEQRRSQGGRLSSLRQTQVEVGEDPNFRLNRLGTVIMDRYQQLQAIKPVSEGETTEEAIQRYETVMNLLVHPDAQEILGSIPEKLPGEFGKIPGLAFGITGSMGSEAWIAKTFERLRIVGQDIDFFTFYDPPLEGEPPIIDLTLLHQGIGKRVIGPFDTARGASGMYLIPEIYTSPDMTIFRNERWLIPNLTDAVEAKHRLRQIIGAEPIPAKQQRTFSGAPRALAADKLFTFFTISFPPEVNMRNRRILLEGLAKLYQENAVEWKAARDNLLGCAKEYFNKALKQKHLLGDPGRAKKEQISEPAKQNAFLTQFQETLEASVAFKLGLFTAMLDSTARQTA